MTHILSFSNDQLAMVLWSLKQSEKHLRANHERAVAKDYAILRVRVEQGLAAPNDGGMMLVVNGRQQILTEVILETSCQANSRTLHLHARQEDDPCSVLVASLPLTATRMEAGGKGCADHLNRMVMVVEDPDWARVAERAAEGGPR